MSYTVRTLTFEGGAWLNLEGLRIVAVLSTHKAQPDKWYVTALVEQP